MRDSWSRQKPTEAERAEMDAARNEWEQLRRAAREAEADLAEALAPVTDPVARAVLNLHRDDGGMCADEQDQDGYGPSWPCQTVVTIATALGIPVPAHLVD